VRVWLIEDRNSPEYGHLEAAVQQLAARPGVPLVLLGRSALQPELVQVLRTQGAEIVLAPASALTDERLLPELLELETGVVLSVAPADSERFRLLAECYPLLYIPLRPDADGLWLALAGALAARHRQHQWQSEVRKLQQRLNDRIVIERAKGVLVERLKINEQEAYRRLRVLSRRQRRQIRDIAQSLLDAESLLATEVNGVGGKLLGPDSASAEAS